MSLLARILRFVMILSAVLSCSNGWAFVGFRDGNQRVRKYLNGTAHVECVNGPNNKIVRTQYSCQREVMEPDVFDYFVGPIGVDADKVQLLAKYPGGGQSFKEKSYDQSNAQSEDIINLWAKTDLQRPLLVFGVNEIEYALLKDEVVVQAGHFSVEVRDGEHRQCKSEGYYTSHDLRDCETNENICARFFSDFNDCKLNAL